MKRISMIVGMAVIAALVFRVPVANAGEHPGEEQKEHAGEKHKEHAGEEHKEHTGEKHKEHGGEEHKEHAGEEHKEHGGEEHKEHGGEKVDDDDKADEHSGLPVDRTRARMSASKAFGAAEIKLTLLAHIKTETQKNGGVFLIADPQEGNKQLALKFEKIHDPVRRIKGKGYFACSDFSIVGDTQGKLYDLDFWLNPVNGHLEITDTKIHKNPKLENGAWVKSARYTFVNDNPVVIQ